MREHKNNGTGMLQRKDDKRQEEIKKKKNIGSVLSTEVSSRNGWG